jgi:uncharacterized protein YjbJ (UPF0337 family)
MEPMEKDSARKAGLDGLVEDVKGKVKEVIGRVTRRGDVAPAEGTKREDEHRLGGKPRA